MLKVANSVINVSQITGVLPVVNGGTGVTTSTGTGNTVLSASPTLSTPTLGVATATTLTTSGNVGVGVTLETFSTLYGQRAIQVGKVGVYSSLYVNSGNHQTYLSSNVYNYSGTPTYLADGAASHYLQASGEHAWSTAPSGLIGAAVTLTERMALSTTGLAVTGVVSTSGYTVATLPVGVVGQRAYVTDAVAPAYNTALTGGGLVRVPVFRNATIWVSA